MREIKFRAWSEDKKVMTYGVDFINTVRNYPLMQYIGLKDRNSKDIYDSDLVRMLDVGMATAEYTKPAQIIWGDWQELGWYYSIPGDYARPLQKEHKVEVLGNVYENPGLLK